MPSLYKKHCCYVIGCFAWTVSFALYIFAFAMPTWRSTWNSETGVNTYEGLWQHTCTNSAFDCQSYPVFVDEPFLQASRSLACIALSLYCIAALLLAIHNCTVYGKNVQTENKIVSYLPFVSGILGVATCVLYLATIVRSTDPSVTAEWGLVISCIANCCSCLGGICMMAGSCIDRRRVIRESELHQNRTTLPGQPSRGPPVASSPGTQEGLLFSSLQPSSNPSLAHVSSTGTHDSSFLTSLPSSTNASTAQGSTPEPQLWASLPSSSNPPMALVAVPVSLLTQSSPGMNRSSTADQEQPRETISDISSQVDVARAAPSAPPPEYFYY